jgi:hypothetical protein
MVVGSVVSAELGIPTLEGPAFSPSSVSTAVPDIAASFCK